MPATSRRAFLAFGLAAVLPPFVAAAPTVAQTAADAAAMQRKFNFYCDLLLTTHTLAVSWQRRIRNVNKQKGQTGRKSPINGLKGPPPATAERAGALQTGSRRPQARCLPPRGHCPMTTATLLADQIAARPAPASAIATDLATINAAYDQVA